MNKTDFTTADLADLARRNISEKEGTRQLAQLRQGHAFLSIDRPCTSNDGITTIEAEDIPGLCRRFDTAAASRKFSRFVPASGAASRMFQGLFPEALQADQVHKFRANIQKFPFYRELAQVAGTVPEKLADNKLFSLLLGSDGLNLAARPKGLLPLHRGGNYNRTAFAEHLHESCSLGIGQFHFTVSSNHKNLFQQQFEQIMPELTSYAMTPAVDFSLQSAQSATIALDLQNKGPFHSDNGGLLLRPAGHGALLQNLENCSGDLVMIRNIDNVVPERLVESYRLWTRILGGKLAEVQQQVFQWIEQLAGSTDNRTTEAAASFLQQTFGRSLVDQTLSASEKIRKLISLLDRPIRICGMVPVSGQPGGGPFWSRDSLGQLSPQIIEGVQIDPNNPRQQEILTKSSHFNPVNLACALRDKDGKPYQLADFVDAKAAIITRKNDSGRELLALERPGLWNGAMSGWNSLFIEMPAETFNPIKSLFDLLLPAHQAD